MNKSHFGCFPWGWQKVQSCCDAHQAGWKEQDGALHPLSWGMRKEEPPGPQSQGSAIACVNT